MQLRGCSAGGGRVCGREARWAAAAGAHRDSLAERVVQIAVHQAGLAHARLACQRQKGGACAGRSPRTGWGAGLGSRASGVEQGSGPSPGIRAAAQTEEHELEIDRLHCSQLCVRLFLGRFGPRHARSCGEHRGTRRVCAASGADGGLGALRVDRRRAHRAEGGAAKRRQGLVDEGRYGRRARPSEFRVAARQHEHFALVRWF